MNEACKLFWNRISNRVRKVDRSGARLDDGFQDRAEGLGVRPSCVLGREFYVVTQRPGESDGIACLFQTLPASDPELVFQMNIGSGEEGMDARPVGRFYRLPRSLDIVAAATSQSGDHRAANGASDR